MYEDKGLNALHVFTYLLELGIIKRLNLNSLTMFSMIEVKNQTISNNILKILKIAFIEGDIDFDIINSLKK